MVKIALYFGGTFVWGPQGISYNLGPVTVFEVDTEASMDFVRGLIYPHIGYSPNQCSLQLSARFNAGTADGNPFYTLLPLLDAQKWSWAMNNSYPLLELYVDVIPHISSA